MQAASAEAPVFELQPHDPRLTDLLTDYPPDVFNQRLYESIELIERYSIGLAMELLGELGVSSHLHSWQTPEWLCRELGFQSGFSSSLGWLFERLVETDCIEKRLDGGEQLYRAKNGRWIADLTNLRRRALAIHPGNGATLDLLDHAASIYPAVAVGRQTGEQCLFGPKGIALWLSYFDNENLTYTVNNWVGAVLAADRLSSHARVRVLEIGAGAGSGSETLLQSFADRRLLDRIERYVVTEPNAFFRRRAQRRLTNLFPSVPFEWGTLDLNLPWSPQVTPSAEFDLVYGVNVLHVAKDLLFSLDQATSTLAPTGWLVLGECVRPYPDQPIYPELMFQILESFTSVRTEPEIRPRPGFLTPEQWCGALNRSGFVRTAIAPDIGKIREFYPHFFTAGICGQKPGSSNDFTSHRS